METIIRHIKLVTLLLTLTMLFSRCTVYKTMPVNLDEAVNLRAKVKLEMVDGKTQKYYKVVSEENKYYGIKKIKTKVKKNLLDEKAIATIKIKDKKRSTIATLILSAITVGSAYYVHDNYVGIEMWGNRP